MVDGGDFQAIPSTMIERVEILKDGASAIYGADAVAGVVNIITRRDFEGIEVTAFTGPALDQPIDITTLPATIVSSYGTLIREDLRPITMAQPEGTETE